MLPLRKRKQKLKSQDAQVIVKTFKKKVKKSLTYASILRIIQREKIWKKISVFFGNTHKEHML